MKFHLLTAFTLITITSTPLISEVGEMETSPPTTETEPKQLFYCDAKQYPVSTVVTGFNTPENSEPSPMLHWLPEYFPSEKEAIALCQQVSQDLQSLYEAGELVNLALVSKPTDRGLIFCLVNTETLEVDIYRTFVFIKLEKEEDICQHSHLVFFLDTEKPFGKVVNSLVNDSFALPGGYGDGGAYHYKSSYYYPVLLQFGWLAWLK